MFKIIWKNFYHYFKSYLIFFWSIAFSIAMLFSFMYLNELVSKVRFYEIFIHAYLDSITALLGKIIPLIMLISAFVIIYALKFYIRTRLKDYSMFMILGMRKKMFVFFLMIEYVLSWLISMLFGLALGNIIVSGAKKILYRFDIISAITNVPTKHIYRTTIGCSLGLLAFILVAFAVIFSEKDISEFLNTEAVKEEKEVTAKWIWLTVTGFLLFIIAFVSSLFQESILSDMVEAGLYIAGAYFLVSFGLGILLKYLKSGKNYYSNILSLNAFYYRFTNQKNMLFLQSVIGICIIYLASSIAAKNMPIDRVKPYPNDILIIAEEKDRNFLENWEKEFTGDTKVFPFIWVLTSGQGNDKFGMNLSDFNRIFEQSEVLKKNEVLNILDGKEYGSIELQKGQTDFLDIGGYNIGSLDPEQDFQYNLKREWVQNIFGFDVAGVTVFSNEVFKKAREKDSFSGTLVLKNVTENDYNKALKKLNEYSRKNDTFQYYDKKTSIRQEQTKHLLNLVLLTFLEIMILFYNFFVLYLKLYSEKEYMQGKYEFLSIIGMRNKKKKVTLAKEIYYFMIPAVLLAGVTGGIFSIGTLMESKTLGYISGSGMLLTLAGSVGCYLLIQFVFSILLSIRMKTLVLRQSI